MSDENPQTRGINLYSESSLHIALKRWIAQPGDQFEVTVKGSVIDVKRGDQLIEVQTGNFSALKPKLRKLLPDHPVQIVYPIPQRRDIVKLSTTGEIISRRKSPIKGHPTHVFSELVYVRDHLVDSNLSLFVLMVHEEEIRVDDGRGSWRRKGVSIQDRRLIDVLGVTELAGRADYIALLPDDLPQQFTTGDIKTGLRQPLRVAQRMAYCLREAGWIAACGKRGRSILYEVVAS